MPSDPTDENEAANRARAGAENMAQSASGANDASGGVEPRGEEVLDQPAETPFDHPLFLPAILAGLWVWFGYDGFINQDPEMREHLTFNRVGFAILSVATAWWGYKGVRELRDRGDGKDS